MSSFPFADNTGLPPGAIAGIVVGGVIAALIVIVILIVFIIITWKKLMLSESKL